VSPEQGDAVDALEVLVRHDVRFILVGGLAASLHGSPVLTEDADVTVDRDNANLERLADALREMNARLRTGTEPDGVAFDVSAPALEKANVWTLVTDFGDFDVLMEPAGTRGYADLRRDAVTFELESGIQIQAASVPDLIRMKEASGRAKDTAALPALHAVLNRLERG
jgi:hypothetical protein